MEADANGRGDGARRVSGKYIDNNYRFKRRQSFAL
jgi:hypothetical protein